MKKEYNLTSNEEQELTYIFNQSYQILSPYRALFPKKISSHETLKYFVFEVVNRNEKRPDVNMLFTNFMSTVLSYAYQNVDSIPMAQRILFVLHLYRELSLESIHMDDYVDWQMKCMAKVNEMLEADKQALFVAVTEEVEAMYSFIFLNE